MSKFYRQQLKILNDIESLENEIKELVYNSVTSYTKQENEKELENINICCEKFAQVCSAYFLADLLRNKLWVRGELLEYFTPISLCDFAIRLALKDVNYGEVGRLSGNLIISTDNFLDGVEAKLAHEFPLPDVKFHDLLEDVNKINEERGQKDEA